MRGKADWLEWGCQKWVRSQAGKPVPLDQVRRPFPGQCIMALSAPPLATCLCWQKVLELGVKGALPVEPTLSFQIISDYSGPQVPAQKSPSSLVASLPCASSQVHSIQRPDHVTSVQALGPRTGWGVAFCTIEKRGKLDLDVWARVSTVKHSRTLRMMDGVISQG